MNGHCWLGETGLSCPASVAKTAELGGGFGLNGESFLESPLVGPGSHTVTLSYSPAGCSGGGSGTVTVANVHVLVTSP